MDSLQNKAMELYKNGSNLFITGGAGVGKSYFINQLRYLNSGKKLVITSTTGISALLIDGRTIHSWSGIGLFDETKNFDTYVDKIKPKKYLVNNWKNTNILVIDEISMMHPMMLDLLDYIGQKIRGNTRPMGGIQVILVGDFYQLPPIITNNKKNQISFCFQTDSWARIINETIEFKTIYRQNEKQLMDILNKVRVGNIDSTVIKYLNTLTKNPNYNSNYTHIFPTKKQVADYNKKMLDNIEEPVVEYEAIISFKPTFNQEYYKFPKDTLIEEKLILKKGCFIMINFNLDFDLKIVNGSQGIITDFDKLNNPIIQFNNGFIQTIDKHIWEFDGYTISQYPIMLAYSVTVHKMQGSSIEKLSIDIGKNIFESGQSYVALSRCVSSKYLHISNLCPDNITVNQDVKNFYTTKIVS